MPESVMGVYVIRNTVNGKVYVGSTGNLAQRWRMHQQAFSYRYHENPGLRAACRRWGADVFECSLLEAIGAPGLMVAAEQRWIDHFHATQPGMVYNVNTARQGRLSEAR